MHSKDAHSGDASDSGNCRSSEQPAGHGDIHVASLIGVHDVLWATRARYLVSILDEPRLVPTPQWIEPRHHLRLACEDIGDAHRSPQAPGAQQVTALIEFVRGWNRQGPLVIHCRAGVSRSTAAAFVALCTVNPTLEEAGHARRLLAASPTAEPNRLIVALGDAILGRDGRMIAALGCFSEAEPAGGPARPFRLATAG